MSIDDGVGGVGGGRSGGVGRKFLKPIFEKRPEFLEAPWKFSTVEEVLSALQLVIRIESRLRQGFQASQ